MENPSIGSGSTARFTCEANSNNTETVTGNMYYKAANIFRKNDTPWTIHFITLDYTCKEKLQLTMFFMKFRP